MKNKIHNTPLRAYFFQNMYLGGIQAGIQAQHCTARLFTKYNLGSVEYDTIHNWAQNHETTILLNGGMCNDLNSIAECLSSLDYPWATFSESDEALNGALTSVGVILPEHIWMHRKWMSGDFDEVVYADEEYVIYQGVGVDSVNYEYSKQEQLLTSLLSSKRLMI